MTENPLAFLSLVKTLEGAVGHKTRYAMLEPFPCVTFEGGQPATIPIQNAGRIIAQHVGLVDLTFVIAPTTQEPNSAGHIELRYDSTFVFVEIARDICTHKDAVLATLCHEVSHKFLQVHGIRHGTMQVEQEFLTDVTTVYLGMGKIMLNGCECQRSYTQTVSGKTTTTTQTLKTGYISRECFAFLYRLICEMRQIPREQYLRGLSEQAVRAIAVCEQQYADWFVPQFHTPTGVEELGSRLREIITEAQTCVARKDYALRRARHALGAGTSRIRAAHKPLLDAERKMTELLKEKNNPHLKYLCCIETRESIAALIANGRGELDAVDPGWDQIEALGASQLGADSDAEIVECPIDGTQLRVPGGHKRLLVTCSSCKYRFIVRTGADDYGAPAGTHPGKRRTSGVLQSLKAAFGRH